jgi:hypothetical protein
VRSIYLFLRLISNGVTLSFDRWMCRHSKTYC